MLRIAFLSLTAIICVSLSFVLGGEPTPPPSGQTDRAILVKGNNEFALALHRQLAAKNSGNFTVSPFSISSALAIVHAGARGETETEMAKALHINLPADRQAKAYKELLGELNRQEDKKRYGELTVANALWVQKGFPIRDNFVTLVRENYQSDVRNLDFERDSEGGRKEINRWVEGKTREKIRELLQPGQLDTRTKLVVTNTVYLNKIWYCPFEVEKTKEEAFHSATKKVSVSMMHGRQKANYFHGDGVQLLHLPYNDGRFSMFVLLPENARDVGKLEQELDWSKLHGWMQKQTPHDVEIALPRTKLDGRNSLREPLQALGMRLSFTDKADFSGIVSQGEIQIKDVIHQASISLDEKETEAAAATAVIVFERMVGPATVPLPKATFRANRPFLVFIIENARTDAILFTGRVLHPRQ